MKAIQQEKAAIEADANYEPKAIKLRPTMARYRAEVKAARDKLKSALATARAGYTKLLKIAEAESVNAELKVFAEGKQPMGKPAKEPKAEELKAGMVMLLFDRQASQRDNDGFVEPVKLSKPVSELVAVESIEDWKYDEAKNAISFGFVKIDQPGDFAPTITMTATHFTLPVDWFPHIAVAFRAEAIRIVSGRSPADSGSNNASQ